MVSEFHQLSEKVAKLAELAAALKRENAELRVSIASLTAENVEMSRRIEQAYERVSALLERIPASDPNEETA
ncbi:DUF904 domain-containing protein [Oxalobacteraceae bacterium OM1]|nr:DUF904 domain-containing protein [Oxalobacteraceae bacterium OM1]